MPNTAQLASLDSLLRSLDALSAELEAVSGLLQARLDAFLAVDPVCEAMDADSFDAADFDLDELFAEPAPAVHDEVAGAAEAVMEGHADAEVGAMETEMPTKWYRRAGGSASSRVNLRVRAFNQKLAQGAANSILVEELEAIEQMLSEVSASKAEHTARLREEVTRNLEATRAVMAAEQRAVADVMALARKRAALQHDNPKVALTGEDDDRLNAFLQEVEVSHAVNPMASIDGGRTVGDSLAERGDIQNIHQVKRSMIGTDKDGPKRAVAEIGTFYPERYRRDSFHRRAQDNKSETLGINPALRPPDSALPKYAALNLAHDPMGALGDSVQETAPLSFVVDRQVLQDRGTITSGDSLQQWGEGESRHQALIRDGLVERGQLPTDDEAWNTGPLATFDNCAENFAQALEVAGKTRYATGDRTKNPDDYVEAQIHGELRIDRDIAYCRANFSRLFGNPRFASLYASLVDSGKEIRWYYRRGAQQEGNAVTQPGTAAGARRFRAAWNRAERLWRKSNRAIDEQYSEALATQYKEMGAMGQKEVTQMRAIWEELKR